MSRAYRDSKLNRKPASAPATLRLSLFLALLCFDLLIAAGAAIAQTGMQVAAVRVWPAPDYTRITLESPEPLTYHVFGLNNPERVVIDLDGVALTSTLSSITGKIAEDDPYIKGVRVGYFKPGVLRLVLDLKSEVKPQAFTLEPIGEYGHRLVVDLYPLTPPDPLIAFLEKNGTTQENRNAVTGESAVESAASASAAQNARVPDAKLRPPTNRLIIVAVDAGHGGEDPGARGRRGTHEKDVTLAMARKLKKRIDQERNMRAVLIRDGDYYIPLGMRVQKARRVHADLFVSIHADAFVRPHARGSSVYALSERGATSVAAQWLAKRENDADLIGGVNLDVPDPYLKQTLLDLSQTATLNDSLKVARSVLDELGEINTLHKPHVEQAGFAVLKAPDIPSILVETAFISNPQEERKLANPAYQERVAEAIFAGIKRYFTANPPLSRDRMAQNF